MELNLRSGNILIMTNDICMDNFMIDYTSDFFVDSYCNKSETLSILETAIMQLHNQDIQLNSCYNKRILLSVTLVHDIFYFFNLQTPISIENTIHMLSRIVDLMKENNPQLKFFYPEY